ncbi:MAG: aldose 1-epimerase family protein [Bacteroidota bacterium]|nr:aldose 1-epimerase family protein [Bacteroidota bacterium]
MQTEIGSNLLSVKINSFGAEVCSVKNNNGVEFIWQANKDVWARHTPVLFPIVGKLKDNFFVHEGKRYELPQHGFARDMEFEAIEQNDNSSTFQLVSNNETKAKFPFEFKLQINYSVIENRLETQYKIINPSGKIIYFSVGAHPGFNCPLLPNETFENYYLEFETGSFFQTQLNNGLRTDAKTNLKLKDQKLFLTKEIFDKDALVFEDRQINTVSLCSSVSKHKITMHCKGWPYFGIWTKKGNQQFVCLEPWYGITDHENSTNELLKKHGVIQLAANSEFTAQFSLIFS